MRASGSYFCRNTQKIVHSAYEIFMTGHSSPEFIKELLKNKRLILTRVVFSLHFHKPERNGILLAGIRCPLAFFIPSLFISLVIVLKNECL